MGLQARGQEDPGLERRSGCLGLGQKTGADSQFLGEEDIKCGLHPRARI